MGTCGSKCCFESPSPSISISDPGSPHDKAIISSDPLPFTMPPPPKDPFSESPKFHSRFQIHPYPAIPSSSSSCTTPASSSISTSTSCTATTSSHSSSSSYSTTNSTEISSDSRPMDSYSTCRPVKKKSFSNEFLWSCVENSNIVILDPTKAINQKPVESQISEISITPSQYLSDGTTTTTTRGITTSSLRHRTNSTASMRNNQSNNAKRARSVSPASRTGHKVIKPDPGLWNPVSSNSTRPRTGDLQPPQWRPVNSQRESLNALTGPASRPNSAVKRDWKGPTIKKEAKQRQIQDGEVEVIPRERVKTPPPLVEDLNNPLIAMDCFIFL